MNTCDPNVVEIISAFSVAGVTLRVAIGFLVKLLEKKINIKGFPTLLITFACCAAAVVIYMAMTEFTWMCFLFWTCLVFVGTQAACSSHYFWALDNDLDSAMECEAFVDLVDRKFPDLRIGYLRYINLRIPKTFVHIDNAYLVKPSPNASWVKGVRW